MKLTTLFGRGVPGVCIIVLLFSCQQQHEPPGNLTELPFHHVSLATLEAFQTSTGWQTAGNVFMDLHDATAVEVQEGEGILLNTPGQQGNIRTQFTHQDLDVKMDFMLAPGSAATIRLQDRYEINLADTWNTDALTCGAINTSSEMIPAQLNVCKAPGLWQHLYIKFKVPRAQDEAHEAGAVLQEVYLNDRLIQQQVVLPVNIDTTAGPLVLACTAGTVAFRKLQYKAYGNHRIHIRDMVWEEYDDLYYKNMDTIRSLEPVITAKADSLDWHYSHNHTQLSFNGMMDIPVDGSYIFMIRGGGPSGLLVDDKKVVDNGGTRNYTEPYYGAVTLKKGAHPFQVIYGNRDESLVLEYEGPGMAVTRLSTNTAERHREQAPPMEYKVTKLPGVQRGFFEHHGKVNTYTMAVGAPGGLNYAYDLTRYSPLTLWRGRFIDVSNMWESRGESQLEIPLGAPLVLAGIPSIQQHAQTAAWVDSVVVDESVYTHRGYRLNEAGFPVFFYTYQQTMVQDELVPLSDGTGWERKVTFVLQAPVEDTWFLLGSGTLIEALPNQPGHYAMDDKAYYITTSQSSAAPSPTVVQAADGRYELLLPVTGHAADTVTFNYKMIW